MKLKLEETTATCTHCGRDLNHNAPYKICSDCRPPIPAHVCQAVLTRTAGACETCGTTLELELHHLTYSFGDYPDEIPIFGHERPEDLAALCCDCHHGAHVDPAGDFWVDPQEMENYWATAFGSW